MRIADGAQAIEIPNRRNEHTRGTSHRFHDDGGNCVTAALLDHALEIIRQLGAMRGLSLGERVPGQIVRVRDVIHVRQQLRGKLCFVGGESAHRDPTEAHPVIATLTAYKADAFLVAACLMVGERNLERRVYRLAPRVREEHMVEVAGEHFRQPLGERKREGVPHLKGRRVVERRGRAGDGFANGRAAVPRIDAPETSHAVEDLASVGVGIVHALGGHENTRRFFERAIVRKGHPQRLERRCSVERGVEQGSERRAVGGRHTSNVRGTKARSQLNPRPRP